MYVIVLYYCNLLEEMLKTDYDILKSHIWIDTSHPIYVGNY